MEQRTNEAAAQGAGGARLKKGDKKPLVIVGAAAGVLLAAYLGLCAYAHSLNTIFPGVTIYTEEVGGMTLAQAEAALDGLRLSDSTPVNGLAITDAENQDMLIHDEALIGGLSFADFGGVEIDGAASAQKAYDACRGGFFQAGWRLLRSLLGQNRLPPVLTAPGLAGVSQKLAERISLPPVDAAYEVREEAIAITAPKDGFSVSAGDLELAVETALANYDYVSFACPGSFLPARTRTAQEIYDEVHGEVKNAGYDAETDSIIPEQVGADFDVSAAQAALDGAEPGETVEVPAVIEYPEVTADELKAVLFRDVLGEARTKVGGTAARKSNVKLSAGTIDSYVMNSGDVFSYNEAVGKRTAANGYKPAPAYVKGETVDEIGGGICQTSSTLYLACLRANLAITERFAHRYIPSYITPGMDATVSWGGPDYKFTNSTSYPIKIVTSYENGYLTVKLLGTKTDDITVKMTSEFLSSTPYETVYEDDATLAPGTEQVKTTPYTGSKYRTYRNLYDGDGRLISSSYEATSDYKARNKVILRGPAKAAEPSAPVIGPGDIPAPEEPDVPVEEPMEEPMEEPPSSIIVLPEDAWEPDA